jgi:hypothetical protein
VYDSFLVKPSSEWYKLRTWQPRNSLERAVWATAESNESHAAMQRLRHCLQREAVSLYYWTFRTPEAAELCGCGPETSLQPLFRRIPGPAGSGAEPMTADLYSSRRLALLEREEHADEVHQLPDMDDGRRQRLLEGHRERTLSLSTSRSSPSVSSPAAPAAGSQPRSASPLSSSLSLLHVRREPALPLLRRLMADAARDPLSPGHPVLNPRLQHEVYVPHLWQQLLLT